MRKIVIAISALVLLSCSEEVDKNTMVVQGNVEGLKKGKIFLQKIEKGNLVNLDSVEVKGNGIFSFKQKLEEPEIFYVYLDLDKQDGTDFGDRLLFFGEPKTITITSKYQMFDINAKIEGSESQKTFEEYSRNVRKFNIRNLELLEQQLNAMKEGNTPKSDSLAKIAEKNNIRRYLYALNFALANSDSYVAPYVILSDTPDANPKYLDSIYKGLSPRVANSKYGKELKAYIDELKSEK